MGRHPAAGVVLPVVWLLGAITFGMGTSEMTVTDLLTW